MKINDLTDNSSFTELSSDEAAKVNGGSGWYPNLSNNGFYSSLGSNSVSAYYLNQNRNRHTPEATLVNGINSSSLAALDRRTAGILAPLYQNGIQI